jgi:hypothetical protein
MRAILENAPWVGRKTLDPPSELNEVLLGSWAQAATEFYAVRLAKEANKAKAPKGVQPFLNKVLDQRFLEAGWEGVSGRYWKAGTWVRVTFRHQMSLGSDLLDALKVCRKSGFDRAVILAADLPFLRTISPNDAAALTSYEKLRIEVAELNGCIEFPLIIGRLQPMSPLPPRIAAVVQGNRPRDEYVPGRA